MAVVGILVFDVVKRLTPVEQEVVVELVAVQEEVFF
jgi:hypothetical protein